MVEARRMAMPATLGEWLAGRATVGEVSSLLASDLGEPWSGREGLSPVRREYLDALVARLRGSGTVIPDLGPSGGGHHHGTGVLLSLMAACPRDGTGLPGPADADPVLHAMAASSGRPRPFAAALGPVFHWAMERRLGRAVADPCFDLLARELAAMAMPSGHEGEGPVRGALWA